MDEQEQRKPDCFDSLEQWEEYQQLWEESKSGKMNFCLDCQPRYRDEMTAQGRCAHPETVFVRFESNSKHKMVDDDDVIGINGSYWSGWMSAISGKRGIIVSPPPKRVRDKFISDKWKAQKEAREERDTARLEMKKKALEMRANGRTYKEIGAWLGVTVNVVSKLVSRSR